MKAKKREIKRTVTAAVPASRARGSRAWLWLVAGLGSLALVFWAYAPALHSPFIFDDTLQKYALPSAEQPLSTWIGPVRPVLLFTYWINTQIGLHEPYSFHVWNVLIHYATAVLIFLIVRR